ncbi:MAG: TRAP transporter substrate-binding protein [Gammaproteobacteria bacterium]
MKRFMIAAMAACIALLGTAQVQAQTNLRFADTLSANDTHNQAARHMAELLKQKTGGKLTMSIHPAGELGSDSVILEGVRLGSIDIGLTGNPFFTQFAPRLNVMDLPYLFRDTAHAHKVMDGPIGTALLKDLERNRMKGLAFWEIGFRHITNSKHPIHTPDDLKGIKIRTTPNKAHIEAFRLWGANPVPMAFTELYLALQTGTVDGQENPINNIYANRMYEVQKYLSLTGHAYTASIMAMNLAKFNSLAPELQKALLESAHEAGLFQREANRKQESDNLAKIKAAGVEVVENIDTAPFKKLAYEPVTKTYTDQYGREVLDEILSVK